MPSQATLFEPNTSQKSKNITSALWDGCLNGTESSIQQLAPYVGKLKSGMARVLIEEFSAKGDVVLDPFCGSGVVPYESLLAGRHAIGNDLNPYAFVVTKGKLTAPRSHVEAERKASGAIKRAGKINVDITRIPEWVKAFFTRIRYARPWP